jgi:predicted TIM-barrel fold metal-dependent hydrolase
VSYTVTEEKLLAAMSTMDIIDSHEHLPPEKVRTDATQDVFTLFSEYIHYDLISAGMKEEHYQRLFDYSKSLQVRWDLLEPFWQSVRYGSYARAALIAAKEVYGVEDINRSTFEELSEKIAAENRPGIYQRLLVDKCNIKAVITDAHRTDVGSPLVPVMRVDTIMTGIRKRDQLEALAARVDRAVPNDLDEHLELARSCLLKWVAEGIVGIKLAALYNTPEDRKAAEPVFKKLIDGEELVPDNRWYEPLQNYMTHKVIDMAAELDLVICTHAGIWGDFRDLDPKYMLTLAPVHPQAKFDLYHLGMPFVRDAIVVAKNLPNVYLNLCWCPIISQAQTRSGIDELLDQVPVNKILAFGGDYERPVEKVVGHLQMAREELATVFAARIDRGVLSFDQATDILKKWFWDNVFNLYSRLKLEPN